MDWMIILVAIGVVALLWFLFVAVFHPAETVSSMRELDRYVPHNHDGDAPDVAPDTDIPVRERSASPTESDSTSDLRDAGEAVGATDEVGGIWIELDITPLFPSSEHPQIVDLTEVEDPEHTG